MHRKIRLVSPGKTSSHSTALPSFFSSCVQCFCVSIPLVVRPTILQHMVMGSVFLRAQKFGSVPYTQRGVRHKQVCTRVDSERRRPKTCPSPCPARGSNPGSSDLNSDALTTELRPLLHKRYGYIYTYPENFSWEGDEGRTEEWSFVGDFPVRLTRATSLQ